MDNTLRFVSTLNNIGPDEIVSFGYRAVDLSVLKFKKLNIPLTFVINDDALKYFIEENGLVSKVGPMSDLSKVQELFLSAAFPRDLEDELVEAYESLAIDASAPASNLLSADSNHPILIIPSPSYLVPSDDCSDVFHNIRGKDNFLSFVKRVWSSVFSKKMLSYREKIGVKEDFGFGIIVQKMKKTNQSIIAYSKSVVSDQNIVINSFFGLQEFAKQDILGKDYHEVDVNTLMISKYDINAQEFSYMVDPESKEITKNFLRSEGVKQKVNDRQISEVARFVKRAKSFVGFDLKIYLGVKDFYTYVFFVNRLVDDSENIVEEVEETKMAIDDKGESYVESQQKVVVGASDSSKADDEVSPPVTELPDILSNEEARKQVIEEERPELIEYSVNSPLVNESLPEEPVVSEFSGVDTEEMVEQEIEREETLLEEVLKIKELLENMEEHAIKDDRESFNLEKKRLKELLDFVKD